MSVNFMPLESTDIHQSILYPYAVPYSRHPSYFEGVVYAAIYEFYSSKNDLKIQCSMNILAFSSNGRCKMYVTFIYNKKDLLNGCFIYLP